MCQAPRCPAALRPLSRVQDLDGRVVFSEERARDTRNRMEQLEERLTRTGQGDKEHRDAQVRGAGSTVGKALAGRCAYGGAHGGAHDDAHGCAVGSRGHADGGAHGAGGAGKGNGARKGVRGPAMARTQ